MIVLCDQSERGCLYYIQSSANLSTNPRKGAEEGMQVKVAVSKGQNSGEDRRRKRKKEGPFEDQITKENSKEQTLKTQETKKNSLLAENHRTHYPSPTSTQIKTHSKFKKSYFVSLHWKDGTLTKLGILVRKKNPLMTKQKKTNPHKGTLNLWDENMVITMKTSLYRKICLHLQSMVKSKRKLGWSTQTQLYTLK